MLAAASNNVERASQWLDTEADVTADVTASDVDDDPAKLLRLCDAKLQRLNVGFG